MYLNKFSPIYQGVTEIDAANTSQVQNYVAFTNMRVTRLLSLTSTVMSSVVPVVLTFAVRTSFGNSSTDTTIGTLSIGNTSAVGDVYYKDLTGTRIKPGQCVVVKVTTAANTSGKVVVAFEANEEAEAPANLSNMIASA